MKNTIHICVFFPKFIYNDNISNFIPEEDSSIDSEDSSEYSSICPPKKYDNDSSFDVDNLSDCTPTTQKNKNRASKKKKLSSLLKRIKEKKPSSRSNRNQSSSFEKKTEHARTIDQLLIHHDLCPM